MNACTSRRRAFTFVELLVAVVIVTVLAAIGVPNFLEAQLRSKRAVVRSDMAVIEAALRAYYADYNEYPSNNAELREFKLAALEMTTTEVLAMATPSTATVSWGQNDPAFAKRPGNSAWLFPSGHGFGETYNPVLGLSGFDLKVLTTPIPYLARALPRDIFQSVSVPPIYLSLADLPQDKPPAKGVGLRRRYILGSVGPDGRWGARIGFMMDHPIKGPFIPYDPTNGSVSAGEIISYGHGEQEVEPLPPLESPVP
ncbi:MAG: prepilin-type N-terminal cleavage/methylation domain-containing protein [Candidatus Sumerlaeaceae bacterium]|nr:prepilin-type N-terminal cleavage/methylation domain-containing protein [Candidatus Sumerlaeaceae bacterium]